MNVITVLMKSNSVCSSTRVVSHSRQDACLFSDVYFFMSFHPKVHYKARKYRLQISKDQSYPDGSSSAKLLPVFRK